MEQCQKCKAGLHPVCKEAQTSAENLSFKRGHKR